jgi:hypothetical protein
MVYSRHPAEDLSGGRETQWKVAQSNANALHFCISAKQGFFS